MKAVSDILSSEADRAAFLQRGWVQFPDDAALASWLAASREDIMATLDAPEHAQWWRYHDTWFAGVNVLNNDPSGAIPGGPSLSGKTVSFAHSVGPNTPPTWDKAQVSVCRPGYPRPMEGESEGVFRFRRDRDAAHLDGLLKEGPDRRRFLKEFHAYILAIPATRFDADASPFTIWEGSHHIFGHWLRETFAERAMEDWDRVDLTDAYQQVRKEIFETCPRVKIPAHTGAPYLVHRFALHGMAKWEDGATAAPEGRVIVYFRPPTEDKAWWLHGD